MVGVKAKKEEVKKEEKVVKEEVGEEESALSCI